MNDNWIIILISLMVINSFRQLYRLDKLIDFKGVKAYRKRIKQGEKILKQIKW